ncbi:MAG: hypothetical protein A2579_09900 [Lysobacterales bacterium RIFOXYD1_FULL_69_11]|nr:MAG: hypothetical protein A2579_09900 [Xanthomonadales bacterium RIFOXYD1_FULL_69_11]
MQWPVKKIGMQASATAVITGRSKRTAAAPTAIPSGAIAAVAPSTNNRLNTLLPTMLPTAMSRSPRTTASTLVAISGKEVPMATTVRPMTSSLTPMAVAMLTAPSTSHCEPSTRTASPATSTSRCRQAGTLVPASGTSGSPTSPPLPRLAIHSNPPT